MSKILVFGHQNPDTDAIGAAIAFANLQKELGKDAATISKWNSNTSQPSLETLRKIADLLEVDVRELLIPSKLK